jgi:hypothetical protein
MRARRPPDLSLESRLWVAISRLPEYGVIRRPAHHPPSSGTNGIDRLVLHAVLRLAQRVSAPCSTPQGRPVRISPPPTVTSPNSSSSRTQHSDHCASLTPTASASYRTHDGRSADNFGDPTSSLRRVHCVRGEMELQIEVAPRFDYAREEHRPSASTRRRPLPRSGASPSRSPAARFRPPRRRRHRRTI